MKEQSKSIDEYIVGFPKEVQKLLQQMRQTIKKAAPNAEETISYGIPTFTLNGNLVHFAGYKNHIGFYPAASGIEAFKKELSVYAGAKGSVQFPLDKPLPLELVSEIVKFRVAENIEKAQHKNSRRSLKANNTKGASVKKSAVNKHNSLPESDFLSALAAPARCALQSKNINTLQQLSQFSEAEIFKLHGMGQSSIPKLKLALKKEGLSFK